MALPLRLPAQVHPFEVLGLNEGLPQSQVACVTQDEEGYVWAGTWGGLARFNGSSFAYLNTDTGLPSNRVQESLPSRSGDLWIATADGVALWKDHALVVPKDPAVSGTRCRALAEDDSGTVWIGTDKGVVVFRDGSFRRVGPEGRAQPLRVYDLLVETPDVLAVTSEGLLVLSASGGAKAADGPPAPAGTLRAAVRTAEGLWVGTQGHGLWHQSGRGWTAVPAEVVSGRDIYRLSSDRQGTLYVCTTDNGLFFRRRGETLFQHWTTANGLPSDAVNCAVEDREGNLWIGTDIGGLARLGGFSVTNYGAGQGFPSACVFGIGPGPDADSLWVGTLKGALLYRFRPRPAVVETVTVADGLANAWVWKALVAPGGELWILTDSSWHVRKPGKRALEDPPAAADFDKGSGMDMLVDQEGRLWLSGEDRRGGLCVRAQDGRWTRFNASDDGSPVLNCRRLARRHAGGVWVTVEGRVGWCDGSVFRFLPGLPPLPSRSNIGALLEDRTGRFWVGNDGGLAVREQGGQWRLLNSSPGFSNHDVFALGEDSSGTVWVGTARGVFRFGSDGQVHAFTPEDGLAGFEVNQGGIYCDRDGGVWIGTVSGLSRYEADRYRPNATPPRIVVEAAEFARDSAAFPKLLDLSWAQRSVTFRIALLAFRGHKRCAYRARMEGLEGDWLPLRSASELRYTNLPQGRYNLFLQAVNESGVWGETLSLPIRVRPPFWLAWWFRLAGLVVLAGAVVAGHRWRTHLLKRRNEELERQVRLRTEELARANLELRHLATHETLTGLPNRRAILEKLRAELGQGREMNRRFGCIIADLDHFKKVNDTLGHAAGDQVLSVMARKIKGASREGDHMGRYGGDEFLMVLPGADLAAVETVARRISAIAEAFGSGGQTFTVSVSCGGITVAPKSPPPEEAAILAGADALLYEVKGSGRRGFRVSEF